MMEWYRVESGEGVKGLQGVDEAAGYVQRRGDDI